MKILIEEYEYDSDVITKVLNGYYLPKHGNKGKCATDSVGYYFDTSICDCLFFLPKVLITDNEKGGESLVLGRYRPEDIIDPDHPLNGVVVDKSDRDFLHNFSIWIYRALAVYREHKPDEHSIKNESLAQMDNCGDEVFGSHLDTVLALIKFHNQNRDFLLFTMQNIMRGYNKINWNKTISQRMAVRQPNGSFLYMDPVNQKKQANYEEELLVIFYSILNYINKRLGYSVSFNLNFELISVEMFDNYLRGYGRSRLLQIKHKYFSDKAIRLWNLCYSFFDRSWQMYSTQQYREYLLSNTFEKVFEDMIDDLIGDENVMPSLQNQRDGKMIDHIFPYKSLMSDTQIYYVGDSKYYKIGHEVQGESLYKQYTYAKNVIQENLNFFLKKGSWQKINSQNVPYRDNLTEGYNITPNFFISATIDKVGFDFEDPHLKAHSSSQSVDGKSGDVQSIWHIQRQFPNRLFDRDTLWLSQYDINFLFVVALYVRQNDFAKDHFRDDARALFRKMLIPVIEKEFDFHVLVKRSADRTLMEIIDRNYRLLNGKIYHPFNDVEDDDILILALEKAYYVKDKDKQVIMDENNRVLSVLNDDFIILKYFSLDESIEEFMKGQKQIGRIAGVMSEKGWLGPMDV